MTWKEYYADFYEWANSTQISRISQLTSFGSPDEIAEVAVELMDEAAATRLVKKAVAAGVSFSAENCITLMDALSEDGMNSVVKSSRCVFTRDQLDDLCCSISDDVLEAAAKRSNIDMNDDTDEDEEIDDLLFEEERQPEIGLTGKIAVVIGMLGEDKKKPDTGRCNGDCAHCPPHYGYRYGRWYYGHHHTRGCERGGNKGL